MDVERLQHLQERLGVRFRDPDILRRALTHRSAAAENPLDSNERLEFLGDAVVGLVISEALFQQFPDSMEGDLAKSKSYVVSEAALAEAAHQLGLEEFVLLSPGEAASGGRRRRSILADAFEAVVAAVYLDCGIRQARRLVRNSLRHAVLTAARDRHRQDYKSALQEETQARYRRAPVYRVISEEGRDHDKTFVVQALLYDRVIGEGSGKSKKEAEQCAARDALERLVRSLADAPGPGGPLMEMGVQ